VPSLPLKKKQGQEGTPDSALPFGHPLEKKKRREKGIVFSAKKKTRKSRNPALKNLLCGPGPRRSKAKIGLRMQDSAATTGRAVESTMPLLGRRKEKMQRVFQRAPAPEKKREGKSGGRERKEKVYARPRCFARLALSERGKKKEGGKGRSRSPFSSLIGKKQGGQIRKAVHPGRPPRISWRKKKSERERDRYFSSLSKKKKGEKTITGKGGRAARLYAFASGKKKGGRGGKGGAAFTRSCWPVREKKGQGR